MSKNYWTFKHKPGQEGGPDAPSFVKEAIELNSAIMQYEYGMQESSMVTLNWNRIKEVQEGDIIFLRGDSHVHAYGTVVCPRKKADVKLSIAEITKKRSHGEYSSDKYEGCIHFEDSKVFYEDLSDGKGEWGQRVDVEKWKFYDEDGIDAKSKNNYIEGENDYGVLKKLKEDRAKEMMEKLKIKYFGDTQMEIQKILLDNKNLILTGAPGTGKTYLAQEIAKQMIGVESDEELKKSGQYEFVQFHPSYDYTDFVEGLRPTKPDANGNIGFELRDGIFKAFCKKALQNLIDTKKTEEERKHIFIIDEINRAEISKVFGELFFAIDPGYRGEKGKVKTQYANLQDEDDIFYNGFYIPENVYIIGTMNDIDRSVESMDFAMRRRFAWKEIKAVDRISMWDGEIGKWKDEALKRMKSLNKAIENIQGLSSAYHIGPAYFLRLKNYNGSFDQLWDNHLEGVVFEYLRGLPNSGELMKKLKDAYGKMPMN